MASFMLFAFATIGLTFIMLHGDDPTGFLAEKRGEILGGDDTTRLYKLFTCSQCMGFWSGAFCGILLFSELNLYGLMLVLASGFAGSGLATTYDKVVALIESYTPVSPDE